MHTGNTVEKSDGDESPVAHHQWRRLAQALLREALAEQCVPSAPWTTTNWRSVIAQ